MIKIAERVYSDIGVKRKTVLFFVLFIVLFVGKYVKLWPIFFLSIYN